MWYAVLDGLADFGIFADVRSELDLQTITYRLDKRVRVVPMGIHCPPAAESRSTPDTLARATAAIDPSIRTMINIAADTMNSTR
ncbi:hypothetical protein PTKU46_87890 [Paraburkholderia terrae]